MFLIRGLVCGTCENTHGLRRRYFKKGIDLSSMAPTAAALNSRPQKAPSQDVFVDELLPKMASLSAKSEGAVTACVVICAGRLSWPTA